MGFVALLKVSLTHLLAWPLFALVYPLWASIRAIETKSDSETQNLIAYWISFSVILLFEHAFEKLLQWLSFWCYIKLGIVFCLVTNDFAGSLYVYKTLVRPCLSVDLQTFICWFNEVKPSFCKKDKFRVELEKYVKENGIEALENIIAARGANPSLGMKEIKAIIEVKQNKFDEPKVAAKDMASVEFTEKEEVTQTKPGANPSLGMKETEAITEVKQTKFDEPKVAAKDIAPAEFAEKEVTQTKPGANPSLGMKEIEAIADVKQTMFDEPKVAAKGIASAGFTEKEEVAQTKPFKPVEFKPPLANSTFSPPDTKEATSIPKAGSGHSHIPLPRNIQKKWICSLCQVITTSEGNLNSHLGGRRHQAALEELKAKTQTPKMKVTQASVATKSNVPAEELEKPAPKKGTAPKCKKPVVQKQPTGVSVKNDVVVSEGSHWRCTICNVKCSSQVTMEFHLNGSKHLAKVNKQNGVAKGREGV